MARWVVPGQTIQDLRGGRAGMQFAPCLEPARFLEAIEVRARLGYISRSDLLRLYREWCDDYGRIIDDPIILDQTECPPALPEAPQQLSDLMFHDSLAFDARASWDRGRNLLRPGLTPSELGVGGKLAAMLLGAVAIMMIAVLCMAFVDALMSILAR